MEDLKMPGESISLGSLGGACDAWKQAMEELKMPGESISLGSLGGACDARTQAMGLVAVIAPDGT